MIPNFRVYDKNRNKTASSLVFIDFEEKVCHVGFSERMDNGGIIERMETLSLSDVTLMQSTGLVDKNGVEIFEDDVIRCTQKVTGDVFEGIVRYDNRYGFWGVTDKRFDDLCAIPSAGLM